MVTLYQSGENSDMHREAVLQALMKGTIFAICYTCCAACQSITAT